MDTRKMMFHPDMLELKAQVVAGLNAVHSGGGITQLHGLYTAYQAIQQLPEPTKQNVSLANSHILLEITDEFFRWEDNADRNGVFRVIRKFVVWIYELDGYYRDRIGWLIEKLFSYQGAWRRLEPNKPRMSHWREFDEAVARKVAHKRALLAAKHS